MQVNILADHLYDLPCFEQRPFDPGYLSSTRVTIFACQILTMIENLRAKELQNCEEMKQP